MIFTHLRGLIGATAVIALLAAPVSADSCRSDIKRNNILGNAVFTLLFRSVHGEINGWSDVGKSLFWGGTAGYMFYESRNTIGKGDESRGIALAYLASSITENTTLGKHPFATLRYGFGPLELQWHSPFATQNANQLGMGINVIDSISLLGIAASGKATDFTLRNGVVMATDAGLVDDDYSAHTLGRTVTTKVNAQHDDGLRHHELIHTTQYLQYSSFGSTKFDLFDLDAVAEKIPGRAKDSRIALRIEWFNSVVTHIDQQRAYDDRWMEIEAYRLAQDTAPDFHNHGSRCSSQVGFQFHF